MLAPIAGSLLLREFGYKVLWPTCFIVGVLVALGYLALEGPLRRRTRAMEAALPPTEQPLEATG